MATLLPIIPFRNTILSQNPTRSLCELYRCGWHESALEIWPPRSRVRPWKCSCLKWFPTNHAPDLRPHRGSTIRSQTELSRSGDSPGERSSGLSLGVRVHRGIALCLPDPHWRSAKPQRILSPAITPSRLQQHKPHSPCDAIAGSSVFSPRSRDLHYHDSQVVSSR